MNQKTEYSNKTKQIKTSTYTTQKQTRAGVRSSFPGIVKLGKFPKSLLCSWGEMTSLVLIPWLNSIFAQCSLVCKAEKHLRSHPRWAIQNRFSAPKELGEAGGKGLLGFTTADPKIQQFCMTRHSLVNWKHPVPHINRYAPLKSVQVWQWELVTSEQERTWVSVGVRSQDISIVLVLDAMGTWHRWCCHQTL